MLPLEIVAVVFGLLCVVLTVKLSVWCWPAGLIQVTLYIAIFIDARLYSDVGLHVIYVGLNVYGWWRWAVGRPVGSPLPVRRADRGPAVAWLAAAAVATAALGYSMQTYTDADLPYWDAAIAVFSLVAQYAMTGKVLESWLVWVAVDVLAIGVYASKGLYLTAGLYGVFLGLAVTGYFVWRRSLPRPAPG